VESLHDRSKPRKGSGKKNAQALQKTVQKCAEKNAKMGKEKWVFYTGLLCQ
jgi:hypothetical protein